jgi:coenzyme F420-0:L-glutamate ligase/coenzyme F420-1:gamma-L-glutamate ligase
VEEMDQKVVLTPIPLPDIKKGDEIVNLILSSLDKLGEKIEEGDILVITSKIISKARGYTFSPKEIKTGIKARLLSRYLKIPAYVIEKCIELHGNPVFVIPYSYPLRDPEVLETISKNPKKALKLLKEYPNMLLYRTKWGLSTDCGVDFSNLPGDTASYPPPDPDKEALEIARKIREKIGKNVGIVISDTEVVALRPGSMEIAIGVYGIPLINNEFASPDLYGKPKIGGVDLIADMIASSAGLLMGQTNAGIPAVLIRGLGKIIETEEVKSIRNKRGNKNIAKTFFTAIIRTISMKILLAIGRICEYFSKG